MESPRLSLAGFLPLLAFSSGCCALAYEILYMRALTTVLGDMFYVHAALLSTFLVGIGLGSKLAYHFIRWLFVFEILTGLYAVLIPVILTWFSSHTLLTKITESSVLTIITTIFFLAIPSLLIGFSIPLFSTYIKVSHPDKLAFQGVYKAYNLGALVSILVVEFVFIRLFGVRISLALIGCVNLFIGVALVLMKSAPTDYREEPKSFPKLTSWALALSSFTSAVFQMFFLKLFYLIFEPHRENFAIGLSVTMLGIFIGALLASRISIRFETCLLCVPLFLGISYLCYLPVLSLYKVTSPWFYGSEFLLFLQKFSIGCFFALGPMILFGMLLPVLMRSEKDVAEESGHLLWVASMANAVGYLAYVLIAHQYLPSGVLLMVLGGINVVGALLFTKGKFSKKQSGIAVFSMALMLVFVLQWKESNFYLAHWLDDLKVDDEVFIYKSGSESATLIRGKDNIYEWVSYNGYLSIVVQHEDRINSAEMVSGVIPALNAPALDRVLVLGFGTGITSGSCAKIFKHTDVVEINHAFYKMMPHLKHANLDIENNPTASLYTADGRSFLVGKEDSYDVIINSIPAPTYFSASKIYTAEFYRRVVKALKPGGVFSTWIAVPNMSREGVLTILSAIHKNFKYAELRLMRSGYYMLTCSNKPIRVSRRFSTLPIKPELQKELEKSLFEFTLDEFFEDTLLSKNIFKEFVPRVPYENTDDHPVLEFLVIRSYQLKQMGSALFVPNQKIFNIDAVRPEELPTAERFAQRAGFFYLRNKNYFKLNFEPLLLKNPERQAAFEKWKKEHSPKNKNK